MSDDASNSFTVLSDTVDEIIRLEKEKKEIAGEISEHFKTLKTVGFNPAHVRKVVRRMMRDPEEVEKEDAAIAALEDQLR